MTYLTSFLRALAAAFASDPNIAGPKLTYREGRAFHLWPDGTLLPAVRGGDGPVTVQDLIDERGRILTEIDDILDTAKQAERSLTDEERERHDELVAQIERADDADPGLNVQIERAQTQLEDERRHTAHEARRSRAFHVPNINIAGTPPPTAERSLDELLWATDDAVRAGTFDRTGTFTPSGAVNPVEAVAIRSGNGEMVAPRMNEFLPNHREAIRNFQKTVAHMTIFGAILKKSADAEEAFQIARAHKVWAERWNHVLRAMDVDTSAEGGTWVPTGIGASLHEKVRAAGRIAPLFTRINLPTNPWKWPIEGADATAYRVAEPTGDSASKVTASTPGTVAATFDAEILGGRVLFSRSVDADSIIAIMSYVEGKLAQAFVDAEEKAILDGDTDGTHQDSDVGSSTTDARSSWDGLRKKALAETSNSGGGDALTVADLRTARGAMGKWGLDPMRTVYVVGVGSYYDLLGDSEVTTVEKYGGQATILNGELARVNGSPVIVSEHVREDLNASGVHDGITTNLSYALAVNRGEWAMGQRMALDVESDDSIYRESFQRVVVGFMREDFQHIGDAAANDDTSIIYNIT